jgi:hypothetical protein
MLNLVGDTYTSAIIKPFEIVGDVCTVLSKGGFEKCYENMRKSNTLQSTIKALEEDCLQDPKPLDVLESGPKEKIKTLVANLKKEAQEQNINNILDFTRGCYAVGYEAYRCMFSTEVVGLQDKIPSATFVFCGKLFTGIAAIAGIKKYSDAVKSIPAQDSYILQFIKLAHVITLAHSLVKLISNKSN